MKRFLPLVAAAVVASVLAVPSGTAQADTTPPSVMIYGDSITSHYNDITGDPMRGWWSYTADDMGMTPVTSAEGGSGFTRKGLGTPEGATCSGTRFYNRREYVTDWHPNILLIEGGRNDINKCTSSNTLTASTDAQVKTDVHTFFVEMAHRADALWGVHHRNNVYVFTPWGTASNTRAAAIRTIVKAEAEARGFDYIPVSMWTASQTLDGTHPNAAGVTALVNSINANSDLDTRFD